MFKWPWHLRHEVYTNYDILDMNYIQIAKSSLWLKPYDIVIEPVLEE